MVSSDTNDLHTCWEANEIGTETEAGTLAGGDTNRWRDGIEDGEDNGGENGESGNFIKW